MDKYHWEIKPFPTDKTNKIESEWVRQIGVNLTNKKPLKQAKYGWENKLDSSQVDNKKWILQ